MYSEKFLQTALHSYILSFLRLGVRNNCSSGLSDDEPLYDSVASDDDYYTIQVISIGDDCSASVDDVDVSDETMMTMTKTRMMTMDK